MTTSYGNQVGSSNGDRPESKLTNNQAICLERVRPIFVASAKSRNDSLIYQDCQDVWGLIVEYSSKNGLLWLCNPIQIALIDAGFLDFGEVLLRKRLLSWKVMNRKVIDYLRRNHAMKRDCRITDSHDELDEEGNPLIHLTYPLDEFQRMEAAEELAYLLAEVGHKLGSTNAELLRSYVDNPASGTHSADVALNLTGCDDAITKKRIAARTEETCRLVRRHFANDPVKDRPIFASPNTTNMRGR